MKLIHHKNLTQEKWNKYSLCEQLANVGSEVERNLIWKEKDQKYANLTFERMLELMYLTIDDPKNKKRLKELCRLREVLIDFLWGDNEYGSTEQNTRNYFYHFNWTARLARANK